MSVEWRQAEISGLKNFVRHKDIGPRSRVNGSVVHMSVGYVSGRIHEVKDAGSDPKECMINSTSHAVTRSGTRYAS